jgi:hypothetical protein
MKKRASAISMALGLALVTLAAHADANLLTNGGFDDTGAFKANSDGAMSLLPGSTALPGWNVVNSAGLDLAWLGPKNAWQVPSSQGGYFLDLAGYHGSTPWSGISQTFATKVGDTYTISFDLGYYGSSPSSLQVNAGDAQQTFTTGAKGGIWDHETFSFKASSANTTLTFLGLSASNGNFLGLDNVSATLAAPVPEPETYALMLVGLGMFAAWKRKQRSGPSLGGLAA